MITLKNNLVAIIFAIGAVLVVCFIALIIIIGKDPTQYIGSLTTLIGFIAASGVLGDKLQKVAKNVNGNSTKLLNENLELRKQVADLLAARPAVDLRDPNAVLPPLMSDDTIGRIKKDVNSLPSN